MSDRIDEYHGAEAKVLTTDEVERWQEFLGDGIQLRRTLATTRALEKLEEGLRLWHGTPPDERARLAIDKAGELWRSAVERAEKAEAERDEARDRVSALETALLDACREKVVHGHTTTLLSEAKELRVAGIEQLFLDADQIRDEAKTLVSELVTALTGLERRFLDPKPGDPGGSCWCDPHRYLELQGHEDECEVARAALAKAKESANG